MTKLDCTVTTCVHNAEKCCCKDTILVEGAQARNCCDTCCGSFEENRGGLFKNLFKTPESKLQVDCDVMNCLYNDDRTCRAERITIAGDGAMVSDRQSVRASGKNKKGSDGTQRTWNPAAFCVFRLFTAQALIDLIRRARRLMIFLKERD